MENPPSLLVRQLQPRSSIFPVLHTTELAPILIVVLAPSLNRRSNHRHPNRPLPGSVPCDRKIQSAASPSLNGGRERGHYKAHAPVALLLFKDVNRRERLSILIGTSNCGSHHLPVFRDDQTSCSFILPAHLVSFVGERISINLFHGNHVVR